MLQKLTRRDFIHISALAVTGALAAACRPAAPQVVEVQKEVPVEVTREIPVEVEVEKVVTATPAPPEQIHIVIWEPTFEPENLLMADLMAQYSEMHPNVTFTYEDIVWNEVGVKVAVAMASGGGPDLFMVPTYNWPKFIEKGTVVELEPMAFGATSLSELEAQYVPRLLELFKVRGKLWVAPAQVSSYLVMYSPVLWPDGFANTWEDLVEASRNITKQDNGVFTAQTMGFSIDGAEPLEANLGPFVWEFGGDFISQDATKAILNRPEGVAGVELMRRMIDEKVWVPDFPYVEQALLKDIQGATMCGDWCLPESDADAETLGVPKRQLAAVPVPEKGVSSKNFITAWGYLVSALSAHPFEAWQAIAFFTNAQNSRRWTEECGMYNGRLASWVVEIEQADPRLRVAHEQIANGMIGPMTSKFEEIMEVFVQAVQAIMLQDSPIQATLDQACDEVDRILAER